MSFRGYVRAESKDQIALRLAAKTPIERFFFTFPILNAERMTFFVNLALIAGFCV